MGGQNIEGVTCKELIIGRNNPTIANTMSKASSLDLLNDTQMVLAANINNDIQTQLIIDKSQRVEEIKDPFCLGDISKKKHRSTSRCIRIQLRAHNCIRQNGHPFSRVTQTIKQTIEVTAQYNYVTGVCNCPINHFLHLR